MQQNIIVNLEGQYKLASISQVYPNNYQITLFPEQIKRKIKQEHIVYSLQTMDSNSQFSAQVVQIMPEIDSLLLYELLEHTTVYSIDELSQLYFGNSYSEVDKTALLFKLEQENIYYTNYFNGTFRKNTPQEIEDIQKAQEVALVEQQTIQNYYNNIIEYYNSGINVSKDSAKTSNPSDLELILPPIDVVKLLQNPNKESHIFKAFQLAQQTLNMPLINICYTLGLIPNLDDFFYESFVKKVFRSGINYQRLGAYNLPTQNETTPRVFSIDDITTKEIDDAFSVISSDTGYTIGIHIAAPALDKNLTRNVLDQIATIYYPNNKITMLGEDVINEFSLNQGTVKPTVSLYFNLDLEYNILDYTTTLESLYISDNLRIEQLDSLWDDNNTLTNKDHVYIKELKILQDFAAALEKLRGKQNTNHDLDYSFSINEAQQIKITPRKRGTPVDKLVSELMILANSTWGRLLTNSLLPALYRSKRPNFPVLTTTAPQPHVGLNVDYYTWASSPLRRAVDYINQAQIIGMITNTNYLAKEYLFELAENFDVTYSKYLEFQNKMERYWSLRYLIQEQITTTQAIITYKYKAMLQGVPLSINLEGIITNPVRDSVVIVKIFNIDLVNLTFEFKVIN